MQAAMLETWLELLQQGVFQYDLTSFSLYSFLYFLSFFCMPALIHDSST